MKKLLFSLIVLTLLVLFLQPSYGQIRKKHSPPPESNEIDSPKERLKSRRKNQTETKVKVRKKRNFVEKKSKNNTSKNKVSKKSIETVVPIEDSKAFSRKKKKPLKSLKESSNKAGQIADSEGKFLRKRPKNDKESVSDEKISQRVKKKSLKKQKKAREDQANSIAKSEGKVRVKKAGSDKVSIADEKVTQKIKSKSVKRQRKENEKQAKSIAGSEGKVKLKRAGSDKVAMTDEQVTQKVKSKSLKRQRKNKENLAEKIAGSDGPVEVEREAYRKRPGTVYSEDKRGGSKYSSQGEKGAYTLKGMSPEKKEKKIARKSQTASNYQGDTKLAKRDKDLHPSSTYLDGRKKNSHEEKEKLRKKELKKSRTKNGGQPKVVTEKRKKPKYDSRENEIWYE